jgi:very-short-patch-repair endonuclease
MSGPAYPPVLHDGAMDYRFLADEEVFAYARAVAMGASPEGMRQAHRRGDITRLHHGWYTPGRPRDPLERHRLRVVALLQEYEGRAVASHVSALVWHGLPLEGVDLGVVHLMWRDRGDAFRSYSRTHIHECAPGNWIPPSARAVDPALAVVQAGMVQVSSLLVAADAALRSGSVTPSRLRAAAEALKGQRGITAARKAIDWCDGRHESPGETLAAQLLRSLGYSAIPQVVIQRTEAPGRIYVADFLIEGTRVIVEFDGRGKYDDPSALFAEKQREDELRRLGYVVVRLTWEDLSRPQEVRRRLAAAVASSGSVSA